MNKPKPSTFLGKTKLYSASMILFIGQADYVVYADTNEDLYIVMTTREEITRENRVIAFKLYNKPNTRSNLNNIKTEIDEKGRTIVQEDTVKLANHLTPQNFTLSIVNYEDHAKKYKIELHDTVQLMTNTHIEESNLTIMAGDTGTVVHIHKPNEVYEVEFSDKDRQTYAMLTLDHDSVLKCTN